MSSFEIEESPAAEEPRDQAEEYILSHPISNVITADLAKVLLSEYSTEQDRNHAILDAFAAVEARLHAFGESLLDNH